MTCASEVRRRTSATQRFKHAWVSPVEIRPHPRDLKLGIVELVNVRPSLGYLGVGGGRTGQPQPFGVTAELRTLDEVTEAWYAPVRFLPITDAAPSR